MMVARNIGLHLALLFLSAFLAWRAWTAEDEPARARVAATLWKGQLAALKRIEFQSERRHVVLEPAEDDVGRYYIGTVQGFETAPSPHTPHGAADDAGVAESPSEPSSKEPLWTKRFISVDKGEEVAEGLVSLTAIRALGKLSEERLADFGFEGEEDEGLLKVVTSNGEHTLELGARTPGGRDRYVRIPGSGEIYVIAGKLADRLSSAENSLIERGFHQWKDDEAAKVTIRSGNASREVVRYAEQKNFWADADTPETKDETVTNWMSKVARLTVSQYLEELEAEVKPEDIIMRVEYSDAKSKRLGYLELIHPPAAKTEEATEGTKTARFRFVARSEQSRWYGVVLQSIAEQVEADLKSVVQP